MSVKLILDRVLIYFIVAKQLYLPVIIKRMLVTRMGPQEWDDVLIFAENTERCEEKNQ